MTFTDCNVCRSPGGRYLTIPEVNNKRTGRGARLVLPLTSPWNDGNLCLSFRHKLAGHHVGMLQVFVKKGKQYSPAVWGRTGGNGWRHTQITLWGKGLESVSTKIKSHSGEEKCLFIKNKSEHQFDTPSVFSLVKYIRLTSACGD